MNKYFITEMSLSCDRDATLPTYICDSLVFKRTALTRAESRSLNPL